MKDEYIIVNKTTLEKRIEELEKQMKEQISHATKTGDYDYQFEARLDELNQVISQSTHLIPEIEKAFDAGYFYFSGSQGFFKETHLNIKDYILNLYILNLKL